MGREGMQNSIHKTWRKNSAQPTTVYDHVIKQIQQKFYQPDYKIYAVMESILIDGMMGKPIDCVWLKK